MNKDRKQTPGWIRWLPFLGWTVLTVVAGNDIYQVAGHGAFLGHFDKIWGAIFVTFFVFSIFSLFALWIMLWRPQRAQRLFNPLAKLRQRIGWFIWPLAILAVFWPARLLNYTDYGFDLTPLGIRVYLFVLASGMGALILTEREKIFSWIGWYQSIILFGVVSLFSKVFVPVTDFPLSLYWSEGNRIWDYSVLFGRDLYIYPHDAPLEAYIDRGRQSLWGLPFLLPDVTISQVRMWSALVYTIPLAIFGWILFRSRVFPSRSWVMVGFWTMLFLYQGPIYTPLVLAATLIAIARGRTLWLALPLIFIAGYYAQLSRLTWMFAPAIWAGMAGLQHYPPTSKGIKWREWRYVFSYGLAGLIGGFGISGWKRLRSYFRQITSNVTPLPETGTQIIDSSSSADVVSSGGGISAITDQALLWSRLWPNPTYREGIVIGLLLAVGPLVVFLFYLAISKRWKLNGWQKAGFLIPMLVFLIVGIVISVKIGGGSNLHNLDMFLVGMVFVTAFAWEAGGEQTVIKITETPIWFRLVVLIALAIPAFDPVLSAKPLVLPPENKVQEALVVIEEEARSAIMNGGEVLFMDQRQLLTFRDVGEIPLVADYEKKLVMDKAMSQDREFFEDFYRDISNQRFALIVSEPQRQRLANENEDWGAENDIWIKWVATPLLCYYEPEHILEKTRIWLLVPRAEPLNCVFP